MQMTIQEFLPSDQINKISTENEPPDNFRDEIIQSKTVTERPSRRKTSAMEYPKQDVHTKIEPPNNFREEIFGARRSHRDRATKQLPREMFRARRSHEDRATK